MSDVLMRELVAHAVGGGWGQDIDAEGLVEVGIIRGADFPKATLGDLSGLPIRWEQDRKVPQRTLQPGDIVLEVSGGTNQRPTGRTVYISERLLDSAPSPVIPASFCRLVRIDRNQADPHYVYWWLQGMHADGRTWAYQNRSTGIANFQFEHFLDTERVHLPILEVQRSIAATLGALDDKIESNGQSVAVALELLDAIAAQQAAKCRMVLLGSLVKLQRDPADPRSWGDGEVDHFSLPAFDASALPETVPASAILSNKTRVRQTSILVSRLNPRFDRTWWACPREDVPALASTEYAVLTSTDDLSLAGIWLAVRDPYFIQELPRRVTGTSGSHQRVRPADLLDMELPDVRAMPMETKAAALRLLQLVEQRRRESRGLAALRDTLLPELLSGRIRVPEAAEAVEELIPERESA